MLKENEETKAVAKEESGGEVPPCGCAVGDLLGAQATCDLPPAGAKKHKGEPTPYGVASGDQLQEEHRVLRNNVIVGSVNANKRHSYKASQALARADRAWLSRLITRREKPGASRSSFRSGSDPREADVVAAVGAFLS